MTKPFDPHRPFTTLVGGAVTLVAVLEKPTPSGETIIVQDSEGKISLRHPDGRVFSIACSPVGGDLVNIPERVEVEAWAVVDERGKPLTLAFSVENAALCQRQYGGVIVPLKGIYER